MASTIGLSMGLMAGAGAYYKGVPAQASFALGGAVTAYFSGYSPIMSVSVGIISYLFAQKISQGVINQPVQPETAQVRVALPASEKSLKDQVDLLEKKVGRYRGILRDKEETEERKVIIKKALVEAVDEILNLTSTVNLASLPLESTDKSLLLNINSNYIRYKDGHNEYWNKPVLSEEGDYPLTGAELIKEIRALRKKREDFKKQIVSGLGNKEELQLGLKKLNTKIMMLTGPSVLALDHFNDLSTGEREKLQALHLEYKGKTNDAIAGAVLKMFRPVK